jgi:tetratricopeptide (TPR) repeat protein
MATLQTQDANILDAEVVNWRRIVYPIVGFIVLLLVGLGIYYYQLSQRDAHEAQARQAFIQAKTPEALVQVADKFTGTTQADFALISAADLSMGRKDYPGAAADYQRVIDASGTDDVLKDAARVGLASAQEAESKLDDALQTYLAVAHRGPNSPYAPFAYSSAARLYAAKKDIEDERKTLSAAVDLGGDSSFVKQADYQLKELNAARAPATPAPVPSSSTPPPPAPPSPPAH